MDAQLTDAELYALCPHRPTFTEQDMRVFTAHERVAADAATRKALWTLQRQMVSLTNPETSIGRAWGHCSHNVLLWLEMAGIEYWEPQEEHAEV